MPRHIWSILCQQVIIDKETNLPSYISCIEGFILPTKPFPFPPVFVGTLWKRAKEEDAIEVRVRVFSPGGDVIFTRAHPRKPFEKFQSYRINLQIAGFDVSEPGEHNLAVEHKEGDRWVEDARLPVEVNFAEAPSVEDDAEE